MSTPFFTHNKRDLLNSMNPSAARVRLGDIITDLEDKVQAGGDITLPVATATTDGLMSASDKAKLNGVSTGATANDTDANLKNRANHTGTQSATTVSVAADAASGVAAGNLQTTIVSLAARLKALEDSAAG